MTMRRKLEELARAVDQAPMFKKMEMAEKLANGVLNAVIELDERVAALEEKEGGE